MTYYIRSKSGEAKAKVSNDIANKLMRETQGHFREAHYQSGKKTVFEFQGDYTYGIASFTVLIWQGDCLVPAD